MDPLQNESQARALAATRRIMAVMKLEVSNGREALAENDQRLLEGYDSEQLAEDLDVFVDWHRALGTDPETALAEMRHRMGENTAG